MANRFKKVTMVVATAGCLGLLQAPVVSYAAKAESISISETGSSLLYPLFNGEWIPAYTSTHPNVHITAAATGSGAGIAQAIAGTVQIGASDAYMPDAQMKSNPTMLNIPLAISAQQVMYNLPGLSTNTHLNFSGNVLADIYMGKVQYWDDAAIKKMNPHVKLPHQRIIPIHRSDSSGDTFLFTQFLTSTSSAWANSISYGTSVSWSPVEGAIGAKGNSGIVDALKHNPYSISYVGISWLSKAVQQGIGYAALKNRSGNYVLPIRRNIQAAAYVMAPQTPKDERLSMVYAPGKYSYPIVNFEYAIVNSKQPNAQMASAIREFLSWAISPNGGNKAKLLTSVNFLPLPVNLEKLSKAQINKIH
jgi:phosphate transport system substrate-binding protein